MNSGLLLEQLFRVRNNLNRGGLKCLRLVEPPLGQSEEVGIKRVMRSAEVALHFALHFRHLHTNGKRQMAGIKFPVLFLDSASRIGEDCEGRLVVGEPVGTADCAKGLNVSVQMHRRKYKFVNQGPQSPDHKEPVREIGTLLLPDLVLLLSPRDVDRNTDPDHRANRLKPRSHTRGVRRQKSQKQCDEYSSRNDYQWCDPLFVHPEPSIWCRGILA